MKKHTKPQRLNGPAPEIGSLGKKLWLRFWSVWMITCAMFLGACAESRLTPQLAEESTNPNPPAEATQLETGAPVYQLTQLAGSLYKFSIDGGGYTVKVIASVGDDGILLVDTGKKAHAPALVAALAQLQPGTPKYIINTHAHLEHTGGNPIFGDEPIYIGHDVLKKQLKSGSYLFAEFPDHVLPEIGISDTHTLRFNGEEIRIKSFGGSHDAGDIVVWFTGSKVACVGALSNGNHFPSVDETYGDVLQYAPKVEELLAYLPDGVKIIPGHGEDGTMDDLRQFHQMLMETRRIVEQGIASGKTLEILQKEDVLAEWKHYEGSYTNANRWIKYLYDGLKGLARTDKALLFEPMYYTIEQHGVDAAIARYHQLKEDEPETYEFDELSVINIAYLLFVAEKHSAALSFFQLFNAEYPDSPYRSLGYEYIGRSFLAMDEPKKALKSFKQGLDLDPENASLKEKIQALEQSDSHIQ